LGATAISLLRPILRRSLWPYPNVKSFWLAEHAVRIVETSFGNTIEPDYKSRAKCCAGLSSGAQRQSRGEFVGVGLEVAMEDDRLEVVAPIENSFAARAGIAASDVITKIDNKPVSGMTLDQVVEKLHGPKNTPVKLTIRRKGHDRPIEITIIRQVINVKSVQSRTEGNDIGYIRITEFTEQTTDGLRIAIRLLTRQIGTGNIKGFVLDLRNNPGGLFDQAVSGRIALG
jgi:carboxyl-terminal processing protease